MLWWKSAGRRVVSLEMHLLDPKIQICYNCFQLSVKKQKITELFVILPHIAFTISNRYRHQKHVEEKQRQVDRSRFLWLPHGVSVAPETQTCKWNQLWLECVKRRGSASIVYDMDVPVYVKFAIIIAVFSFALWSPIKKKVKAPRVFVFFTWVAWWDLLLRLCWRVHMLVW